MADPMVARRVEIRLPAPESTDELKDALSDFARTLSDLASPRVKLTLRDRRDHVRRLDLELIGRAADVASVVEAVGRLGAQVMRDEVLPAPWAPKDPPYPDPESARRIAAPASGLSHSPTTTEPPIEPVIVAIIDSGIMAAHPDLLHNLWSDRTPPGAHGRNMIGPQPTDDIKDEDGHGTMLAGTVLAGASRSPAVHLMAVKLFDGRTRPESGRAARAIDWAVDHGADILNLSWAVGVDKPALRDGELKPAVQDAIARAGRHNVLVVVAAGNSGADNDTYPTFPASYGLSMENVITVMATDDLDDKPGFSNYGAESVHIAAPGMRVISTHPYATLKPGDREKYQRYDGTSAAAAYVAGAAALLKSVCPKLPLKDLKNCLINTADPSRDLRSGAKPRLNVGKALAAARVMTGCHGAGGTSDEVLAAGRD
jgi:Subtilase family